MASCVIRTNIGIAASKQQSKLKYITIASHPFCIQRWGICIWLRGLVRFPASNAVLLVLFLAAVHPLFSVRRSKRVAAAPRLHHGQRKDQDQTQGTKLRSL